MDETGKAATSSGLAQRKRSSGPRAAAGAGATR